jgi:hypothetical protein
VTLTVTAPDGMSEMTVIRARQAADAVRFARASGGRRDNELHIIVTEQAETAFRLLRGPVRVHAPPPELAECRGSRTVPYQ